MQINSARLLSDLLELASLGQYKTGVNRPAFSEADIAARHWLARKMIEAGLHAEIDRFGNVLGRNPDARKTVLVGSHTDTVPNGGWLDGSLGVIYGLEIARCFIESNANEFGVDAISFQDEEGTFLALMGSRAFCGEDLNAEIETAKDKLGSPLKAAMGLADFRDARSLRLDPTRQLAYFEAHIEQGPRLENAGCRVGVVTGIVGIRTFEIRFLGQADHAGTTPMTVRRDAGAAALHFGSKIWGSFKAAAGPDTVWNIGNAAFRPGASNVVPSEVVLVLQFRDTSDDNMDKLETIIGRVSDEVSSAFETTVEIARTLNTKPTQMSREIADLIAQAASELGEPAMHLPSGAGHDAMVLARYIPAGMLFVPSIGGRSHDIVEDTAKPDIVRGAEVLLRAVELSGRDRRTPVVTGE
jgi:N-carbamoyl-L-amino-acid hydrolase